MLNYLWRYYNSSAGTKGSSITPSSEIDSEDSDDSEEAEDSDCVVPDVPEVPLVPELLPELFPEPELLLPELLPEPELLPVLLFSVTITSPISVEGAEDSSVSSEELPAVAEVSLTTTEEELSVGTSSSFLLHERIMSIEAKITTITAAKIERVIVNCFLSMTE